MDLSTSLSSEGAVSRSHSPDHRPSLSARSVEASSAEAESSGADNSDRKRVAKACNRCRVKKARCDGSKHCKRCCDDNQSACVYSPDKRPLHKNTSPQYVDFLEESIKVLGRGLQELYNRAERSGITGFEGVERAGTGTNEPIIPTLLSALDVVKDWGKLSGQGHDDAALVLQALLAPRPDNQQSQASLQQAYPAYHTETGLPNASPPPFESPSQDQYGSPHQRHYTPSSQISGRLYQQDSAMSSQVVPSQRESPFDYQYQLGELPPQEEPAYGSAIHRMSFDSTQNGAAVNYEQMSTSPLADTHATVKNEMSSPQLYGLPRYQQQASTFYQHPPLVPAHLGAHLGPSPNIFQVSAPINEYLGDVDMLGQPQMGNFMSFQSHSSYGFAQ